ncbi:MAG: hypothetical protein OK454_01745 [Thaumarchaeota archaeon]|nr:hypothetical protein [Nitrososphaerota archaeon]
MDFDLKRPCPKCPFRQDIPGYLHGERAREIAEVLARGGTFACHQTTVEAPEDDENFGGEMMEGPKSQMCAGSMIALMQSGGPNQIMRVAERVGGFDPDKLDRTKSKVGSLSDFVAHHAGEDEGEEECCSIVDSGCEHPAGIMMEGTILPAEEKEETTPCQDCGEYVCENCSEEAVEGGRVCNSCAEYNDDEEDEDG